MLRTHFHLHVALAGTTNEENLGTLQKAVLFSEIMKQWIETKIYIRI
jgi:hypothetical protein